MIYKCKKCKIEKTITKASIIFRDKKWVALEALCKKCNEYMEGKTEEGFPDIIRTDPTLRKNNG